MILIGLTGGIGMGKSTVADYLIGRGEKLVDTDQLARELVEPGQPALGEIQDAFGRSVIDAGGRLDRKALAEFVFASPEARQRLESILHPRIRAEWRAASTQWREAGLPRAFVVIPLLYETDAQNEFGQVICVACSRAVQKARLLERGWSEEEVNRRNSAQWNIARKMDLADAVIWNESTRAMCEEQCARLLSLQ